MNPCLAILSKIVAELRMQWLGRRALRAVRFRKYRIPLGDGRRVRERLLRQLTGCLETTSRFC